jgi:hypothetical protein
MLVYDYCQYQNSKFQNEALKSPAIALVNSMVQNLRGFNIATGKWAKLESGELVTNNYLHLSCSYPTDILTTDEYVQ